MVKKILILGASGMLGGSLFRYLSEIKSLDILGTVRSKSASEELRLRVLIISKRNQRQLH